MFAAMTHGCWQQSNGAADNDASTDNDTEIEAGASTDGDSDSDVDTDADSDSDTDTDNDADTDTDSDNDTDTDSDTDTTTADSSNFVWAKSAGGNSFDHGVDIAALPDESALVLGFFRGMATFGEDNDAFDMISTGSREQFLAMYDSDGNLVWVKSAGGSSGSCWGRGIATDSGGISFVTGSFAATTTFGEGVDAVEITPTGSDPLVPDIFVAKYRPDGTLVWVEAAGGESGEIGWGVVALSDGSVMITGQFTETVTFGKGANEKTLIAVEADGPFSISNDIFIAKYDSEGALVWAKSAGGAGVDIGKSITARSDGFAIVTGKFDNEATFGAGEEEVTVIAAGDEDVFVAVYRSDGTLAWVESAGGPNTGQMPVQEDVGHAIAALPDGSVAVAGIFSDEATFGEGGSAITLSGDGPYDLFVAKYSMDGTLVWADKAGGVNEDSAYDVASLPDGSISVTGFFRGEAAFGRGEDKVTVTAAGGEEDFDIFVAVYRPDGTLAWVERAGGVVDEYDIDDYGSGISAVSDGSVLVTGKYSGTAVFGAGDNSATLVSADSSSCADTYDCGDIFIAKYSVVP